MTIAAFVMTESRLFGACMRAARRFWQAVPGSEPATRGDGAANSSIPMKRDEEWTKLAGIIRTAVGRADDATGFHAAAAQQLDLAQYALSSMLDELTYVMAVPGRRGPALVRVLEPRLSRSLPGVRAA